MSVIVLAVALSVTISLSLAFLVSVSFRIGQILVNHVVIIHTSETVLMTLFANMRD